MRYTLPLLVVCLLCCFKSLAQNQKSIDSLSQMLKSSLKDEERISIYISLAEQYQDADSASTMQYTSIAKELADKINSQELAILALLPDIRLNISLGNYEIAKEIVEPTVQKSRAISFSHGEAKGLELSGRIERYSGNYGQALMHYRKALDIFTSLNDKESIASIANAMGIIYSKIGDTVEAIEYFLKALDTHEALANHRAVSKILNNIGIIFKKQGDYDKALEFYNRSIDNGLKIGCMGTLSSSYNNIGNVFISKKEYERAISYYNKSFEIRSKIGDKRGIADNIMNRAEAQSGLKRYNLSISEYQKAMTIFEEIGDREGLTYAFYNIGKTYFEINRLDSAEYYFKRSVALSREIGYLWNVANSLEALSRLNYKLGDYSGAYLNLKGYNELSDSLKNDKKLSEMALIEAKYEFDKREEKLQFEQEKSEIEYQKSLSQQRFVLLLVLVISLAILVILIIFIRAYVLKQKTNLKLSKINKEILLKNNKILAQKNELNTALKGKELLMQEMYHRTKNNLLMIENLFSAQMSETKDLKVKNALEANQSRLESISLIHKILFQNEYFETISLEIYIRKLVNRLHTALAEEHKIHIDVMVDDVLLHVNYMMPIALIVNEILTNAFKHAFSDQQYGKLKITGKYSGENLSIEISDNGKGFNFNQLKHKSFGLILIEGLVDQLRGAYHFKNDFGTTFKLKIPIRAKIIADRIRETSVA
ncbi:MAG: tetratricopeptide repeat protein [Bacteroidota bacterium]